MEAENSNSALPDLSGLGTRIAKIADLVGGKKNLAQAIGISESQLYRYISGDSQPTVEPLAAIAKCGHVHLDWLVLGDGPTGLLQEINDIKGSYSNPQQLITIAEYQHSDQMGPGAISVSSIGRPAFNQQWLQRSGLNPDHLRLSCAGDDSMAPTIKIGDLLLINITQNHFAGDAVYLLRLESGLVCAKRLQHKLDNGLYMINDNPAYRDQEISEEHKHKLDIVGRVVWSAGLI